MHQSGRFILKVTRHCGAPPSLPSGLRDRYAWLHEEAPYSLLAHRAGIRVCQPDGFAMF